MKKSILVIISTLIGLFGIYQSKIASDNFSNTIGEIARCESINCSKDKINIIKENCKRDTLLINDIPIYMFFIDYFTSNEVKLMINKKCLKY